MTDDAYARAYMFADCAHRAVGQKRKYTGEAYIHHPAAVARLVTGYLSLPQDRKLFDQIIQAALLHDVVEDTQVSITTIDQYFGNTVSRLVADLTDVSRPEDGNRARRKAIDREHTAAASSHAKTIKLADLIDNTKSIVEHDPNFAKVYIKEKRLLLDGPLVGSSSPALYEVAMRTLRNAEAKLT